MAEATVPLPDRDGIDPSMKPKHSSDQSGLSGNFVRAAEMQRFGQTNISADDLLGR